MRVSSYDFTHRGLYVCVFRFRLFFLIGEVFKVILITVVVVVRHPVSVLRMTEVHLTVAQQRRRELMLQLVCLVSSRFVLFIVLLPDSEYFFSQVRWCTGLQLAMQPVLGKLAMREAATGCSPSQCQMPTPMPMPMPMQIPANAKAKANPIRNPKSNGRPKKRKKKKK